VTFRLLGLAALSALINCACFLGGSPAQPTTVPQPVLVASPAPSPVPTKPAVAASPSPVAKPTPTPEPELTTVWVGNTDGEGVYIRGTPAMADRVRAYPDRTPLTIIDVDVDAEGMKWHHVRAPDGLEGYVPVQYTVTTEP
jgi:hypothetical protein